MSSNATLASDKALRPFLAPSFDPADFLNATLPSWTPSTHQRPQSNSVSLPELSTQTQTLLSQLNAQISRLSHTLTQLTDDILRSGGRLAYEVEVLRGDTSSLSDALTDGMRDDIQKFLPGGLKLGGLKLNLDHPNQPEAEQKTPSDPNIETPEPISATPEYITQLHTLTVVRSRLDSVIKVFDSAMSWPIPPSSMPSPTSFISISAPDTANNRESREVKGQEYSQAVMQELSDLTSGSEQGDDAYESALKRIDALRQLALVWKGTAEEKARLKFVESLTKLVEERRYPGKSDSGYRFRSGA